MAGPGYETAAGAEGRGHLRASHAHREQVIEILKTAFVQGRLDKDEFDLRVSQTFASWTYAELAAVTADIPAGVTTAKPPTPARTRGEAAIPRPGRVLTVATVLYPGMWAFLLLTGAGQSGTGAGPGALIGIATVFYLIIVIFAGAQLIESRQQERSGGQSPRRPAPGAGGRGAQRLPSASPSRQPPPGHRTHWHTAKAARRRLPRPPCRVRGHCAGTARASG